MSVRRNFHCLWVLLITILLTNGFFAAGEEAAVNYLLLSDAWKCHLGDAPQGQLAPASLDFDDKNWEWVNVPGEVALQKGSHPYEDIVWYRYRFSLPDNFTPHDVLLDLGRVSAKESRCFLNGQELAKGPGGNTFAVPSNLLSRGGDNLLALRLVRGDTLRTGTCMVGSYKISLRLPTARDCFQVELLPATVVSTNAKARLRICSRLPGETSVKCGWKVANFEREEVVPRHETQQKFAPNEKKDMEVSFAVGNSKYYRIDVDISGQDISEGVFVKYVPADIIRGPRQRMDLSGKWQMCLVAKEPFPARPPADGWVEKVIPFTPTTSPFKKDAAIGAWFSRKIAVPESMKGKRIYLQIDSMPNSATVYWNDERVCAKYAGSGYPCQIDLTGYAIPGQTGQVFIGFNFMGGGYYGDTSTALIGTAMWLVARPDVYVEDTFVKTSVQKGTIEIEQWVANKSPSPVNVTLISEVSGDGKSVLEIGKQDLSLVPGERKQVCFSKKWESPRLWTPDDPYLYVCQSRLYSGKKELDVCKTRFGFREFSIKAADILLNGIPLKLRRRTPFWFYGYWHSEWIYEYVKHFQTVGINSMRLYPAPPERYFDLIDEAGGIIYQVIDPPTGKNKNEPSFYDYLEKNCLETVLARRNHPCIAFWHVENELFHQAGKLIYPDMPRRLAEICWKVKHLDPTRIAMGDGADDYEGRIEIKDIHYPHEGYQYGIVHNLFPNYCFWLEGPMPVSLDQPHLKQFAWRKEKPLMIGEYWGDPNFNLPQGASQLLGEESVAGRRYWIAGYLYLVGLTDGLRSGGVASYNNYMQDEPHGGIVYSPYYIFIRESASHFFSGQEVVRTVEVFNDVLNRSSFKVAWKVVNIQGKTAAEGVESFAAEAGQQKRLAIKFQAPAVKGKESFLLRAELLLDGHAVWRTSQEIMVYAPIRGSNERIGLVSLSEEIKKGLKDAGYSPKAIQGETLPEVKDCPIIFAYADALGKSAVDDRGSLTSLGLAFQSYVRGGGCLVLCNASAASSLGWLPVEIRVDAGRSSTITFPRRHGHPLLEGIGWDDLRWWQKDNIVSRFDLTKPVNQPARAIIDAGGFSGLEWTPLLEISGGAGSYICCQMLLLEKLSVEPAACRLLNNLVQYGYNLNRQKTESMPVIIMDDDKPAFKNLKAIGVKVEQVKSTEIVPGQKSRLMFVRGGAILGEQICAKLLDFVKSGGTLYLHRLTPESVKKWEKFLPADLKLKECHTGQMLLCRNESLLAGLSDLDFFWLSGRIHIEIGGKPKKSTDLIEYEITGIPCPMLKPAGIASFPCGKGKVVLEQVRWDDARETEPVKSLRIPAVVLANLGAEFEIKSVTNAAASQFAYTPIDLGPYMNRLVRDEQAGDQIGGWTDEGGNDLRDLPDGKQTLRGVPFDFVGKCVVLRSPVHMSFVPAEVTGIKIGIRADCLFFLHTSAWTPEGKEIMRYVIHYQDGDSVAVPVRSGVHIQDWYAPNLNDLPGAQTGWHGRNPFHEPVCLYLMKWENPHPEKTISTLDVVSAEGRAIPILLAVTAGTLPAKK